MGAIPTVSRFFFSIEAHAKNCSVSGNSDIGVFVFYVIEVIAFDLEKTGVILLYSSI